MPIPRGTSPTTSTSIPDAQPTLGEVLAGQARAGDAVHGQVIPANLGLAEAELVLAGKMGREVTLRNALRDVKRNHDVILIDCPPTLGLLTVNALVASTHAILSTQAAHFSLQGVEQATEIFNLARDTLSPELRMLGVVLNIANMRTKHARHAEESLRERFGDLVFESVIRSSIAYAESAERGVPILDYKPERGADYIALVAEILNRLDMSERLPALEQLRQDVLPPRLLAESEPVAVAG